MCCITNLLIFIILQNVVLTYVGMYFSANEARHIRDTWLSRDGSLFLNKKFSVTALFPL